jgi:hypothetical protein
LPDKFTLRIACRVISLALPERSTPMMVNTQYAK